MAETRGRIGGSNKVISMHDAADYVAVSYHRFAANYKAWGIAYHTIGGRIKFRERDLEHYLERNRVA